MDGKNDQKLDGLLNLIWPVERIKTLKLPGRPFYGLSIPVHIDSKNHPLSSPTVDQNAYDRTHFGPSTLDLIPVLSLGSGWRWKTTDSVYCIFRTLVEEPKEIPIEPKNENYLSEIAFEDLTYADHEYNSYARPFHEDIPELEHFFGMGWNRFVLGIMNTYIINILRVHSEKFQNCHFLV